MRLLLCALLAFACSKEAPHRGVQRTGVEKATRVKFNRAESAALFVGVRNFTHDKALAEVPYAVDDAVDMAYAFTKDPKVGLVLPERVVVALEGNPVKPASQQRLQQLRAAGVRIVKATQTDILQNLQKQAARVGKGGVFIASFASHGFNVDGTAHILGSSSLYGQPATWVPVPKVLEIAAIADGGRSVIFVDACRERVTAGKRGGNDRLSAAPLVSGMTRAYGQAVFYAAAAGQYSYDDPVRKNGVFTSAILDALNCNVNLDSRGYVTAESLAAYVEEYTRKWIRTNRDPNVLTVTQTSLDGAARPMRFALCSRPPSPLRVAKKGSRFFAYGKDGRFMWDGRVPGPIEHAAIGDLDADGLNDVVVTVSDRIFAFDADGVQLWAAATGGDIRKIVMEDVLPKSHRQVIALSDAGSKSLLSIFNFDGSKHGGHAYEGRLLDFLIDKETARHHPKIIANAVDRVVAFNPRTVGDVVWRSVQKGAIKKIEIIDFDNDTRRDICVTTSTEQVCLDFDGRTISRK
ncbi:MAG TPA: caspase family protein [Thermoanaerobaculia bacterium]